MADGAERLAELEARNTALEAELERYRDAVERTGELAGELLGDEEVREHGSAD